MDDEQPATLAPIKKPVEGWRQTPHLAAKLDEVIDRLNVFLVLAVQLDDLNTRMKALEDAATRP